MIDTIHLLYDFRSQKEREDCIEALKERYSVDFHYRETSDNSKSPVYQCRCWDDNFKIWLISGQLHIEGSITKLYFGNNVQELNSIDLVKAYELFMCKFDIVDWSKAVHKRIDIGINIELSNPPTMLTRKIIGSKRMKKLVIKSHSESVTIGNNSQSIIFYNKTLESETKTLKEKGLITVPDNLLRIEYRITSIYPMKKHFNTDKVTIPYILNNIELLPKIWYEMYLNIEKDYSTGIELFSNKKEMEMTAVIYFGLESMKALIIESYRAQKMALATKQNLLRYLKQVTDYQQQNSSEVNIAKELDDKVALFINENRFFIATS